MQFSPYLYLLYNYIFIEYLYLLFPYIYFHFYTTNFILIIRLLL